MQLSDLQTSALQLNALYEQLETRKYGRAWTVQELALGFMGDVGDLAKLVQAHAGVRAIEDCRAKLAHELSDCLWSVLVLADKCGIDLEGAFVTHTAQIAAHVAGQLEAQPAAGTINADPGSDAATTQGVRVRLSDLEDAFMLKDASPTENEVLLDLATGATHVRSPYADDEPPLPDDIDDDTRYVAFPDKRELDLGRPLVFDFVDEIAPHLAEAVHTAFGRRGAYRTFKNLLERHDLLDRWHAYEDAATKAALTRWAQDYGITVVTGEGD